MYFGEQSALTAGRTLNYTRRVILAKSGKKLGRNDGLFQYHTARSISNTERAADITVSTCLRGVNLNKLAMDCEVQDVS